MVKNPGCMSMGARMKRYSELKHPVASSALLAVSLMIAFTFGCSKEEDMRPVVAQNSCKAIIDNPAVPERTKRLARKVVDGWTNKALDREPVLVHAGYGRYPGDDYFSLLLTMSDEEFDIKGFRIREIHSEPNSATIVLEEEYPIFPVPKIAHAQLLRFTKRENLSQRKDDELWRRYLNGGVDLAYRRDAHPTVWISIPTPPTVEVSICVYDSRGVASDRVPLDYGALGKATK